MGSEKSQFDRMMEVARERLARGYDIWGWGGWVIAAGIICGLITAAIGFRDTVRAMLASSGHKTESRDPGVSFNSHD